MRGIAAGAVVCWWEWQWAWGADGARCRPAQETMAATVMREWPAGMVSTIKSRAQWGYEEGVLLDGMAAEWHATADGGGLRVREGGGG